MAQAKRNSYFLIFKFEQEARFSDGGVTNQQKLEQIIAEKSKKNIQKIEKKINACVENKKYNLCLERWNMLEKMMDLLFIAHDRGFGIFFWDLNG